MKPINKKLAITLLSVTVGLSAFASEYQIKPVQNIDEAVKLIKNLKPKTDKANEVKSKNTSPYGYIHKSDNSPSPMSYTPIPINNFSYDSVRDTITTIYDSTNNPILHIVHNKKQNDPTLTAKDLTKLNTTEIYKKTGYTCDNEGKKPYSCSAYHFYTGIVLNSNSVGANINLSQTKLAQYGKDIVLLDRESRLGTYMKVFIDQNGYLCSKFTLTTGGTTTARTAQPIPFNENVYIQANDLGQAYQVGWKSLDTGNSSIGKAGHQIKPVFTPTPGKPNGFHDDKNTVISLDELFWQILPDTIAKFGITNYFWNTNIPMFANIGKDDLSGMVVYQQSPALKMDLTFVNKVIGDLQGNTNYFPLGKLRAYVDANGNLAAADVREVY